MAGSTGENKFLFGPTMKHLFAMVKVISSRGLCRQSTELLQRDKVSGAACIFYWTWNFLEMCRHDKNIKLNPLW